MVIIDDISEFCRGERGTSLREILDLLREINPKFKVYFDYDMLFAFPYEKQRGEFWRKIAYPFVIR